MITISLTNIIILLNAILSIVAFQNKQKFEKWKLVPYLVQHNNDKYRIISHAFIHADYLHLLFNMYVLFIFGNSILEPVLTQDIYDIWKSSMLTPFGLLPGVITYLGLYFGGILFSSLSSLIRHRNNPYYSSVGASGAVSSIVFASIFIFPLKKIGIMFIPIGFPGFIFGALYLLAEYYMDKKGGGRIAHDAHLWGSIFGIVFLILVKPWFFINFVEQIKMYFQSFIS